MSRFPFMWEASGYPYTVDVCQQFVGFSFGKVTEHGVCDTNRSRGGATFELKHGKPEFADKKL